MIPSWDRGRLLLFFLVAGFGRGLVGLGLPTLDSAFAANQTLINPIIDSREAITHVTIKDANTLVIGGMKMIRKVSRESKIPGLGDIAFIKWLFRNERSQNQVNDLYFFVTPRLMKKNPQAATPTLYYARDVSKSTAVIQAPPAANPTKL